MQDRKGYDTRIVVLAGLMMLDYFLTWLGINVYGVIEEGNPFMVWLFNLPFPLSLATRLILVTVLIGMCTYIKFKEYKRFNLFINTVLVPQFAVMILHIRWLSYINK